MTTTNLKIGNWPKLHTDEPIRVNMTNIQLNLTEKRKFHKYYHNDETTHVNITESLNYNIYYNFYFRSYSHGKVSPCGNIYYNFYFRSYSHGKVRRCVKFWSSSPCLCSSLSNFWSCSHILVIFIRSSWFSHVNIPLFIYFL